jgi:excisionase family DNA binding protein
VGKCWIWYYIKKRGSIMLLKGYLTVEQVAKQLGLSEYRIRELIREKEIKAVKIGQWRVKPEDLKEFVESRMNK